MRVKCHNYEIEENEAEPPTVRLARTLDGELACYMLQLPDQTIAVEHTVFIYSIYSLILHFWLRILFSYTLGCFSLVDYSFEFFKMIFCSGESGEYMTYM